MNGDSIDYLVQTNLPPSPLQRKQILDIITGTETEISRLDRLVHDAEAMLPVLHEEIARRQERLKTLTDILAPIRKLPFEMLAKIFLHHKDADAEAPKAGRLMASHTSPLLVCQVCSMWRNVAIDVPELWDTMQIVLRSTDTAGVQRMRDGITTRVVRRKKFPISLTIDNYTLHALSSEMISDVLMPSLCLAHRLYLSGCKEDFQRVFSPSSAICMPNLRSLRLVSQFELLMSNGSTNIIYAPWTQITSLNLHMPVMDCRDIFMQCTKLVALELHISCSEDEIPFNSSAPALCTHTSLRILALYVERAGFYFHILDGISLPSLKQLTISDSHEWKAVGWDYERFIALRNRSAFDLESFSISNCTEPEGADISLFISGMRSLTTLSVRNCTMAVEDNLMLDLTFVDSVDSSSSQLAPNLRQIELEHYCLDEDLDPLNVLRMIESRCPPLPGSSETSARACLTMANITVAVGEGWATANNVCARLDACRRAGVSILTSNEWEGKLG